MWVRLELSWHGNCEEFQSLLKSTETHPLSKTWQVHLRVMFLAPSPKVSHFVSLEFQRVIRIFLTEERPPLWSNVRSSTSTSDGIQTSAFRVVLQLPWPLWFNLPSYYLLLAQTPSLLLSFSVEANCLGRLKRGWRDRLKALFYVIWDNKIWPFHWARSRSAQCSSPFCPSPTFSGKTIIHWHKHTGQSAALRSNCRQQLQNQQESDVNGIFIQQSRMHNT